MADLYRRTNRVTIKTLSRAVANLHSLPVIGAHVGGGRHVDMPAEFTYDEPNPGWTSLPYAVTRRFHPTNDDWGVLIDDATQALFNSSGSELLTPQQQGQFTAAVAAALALDAAWEAAAPEAGNPLQTRSADGGAIEGDR